jgi:hypothetical protein
MQFKQLEHPDKRQRDEVFKHNLVIDSNVNLKVYRPVNQNKNLESIPRASILAQLAIGKPPVI